MPPWKDARRAWPRTWPAERGVPVKAILTARSYLCRIRNVAGPMRDIFFSDEPGRLTLPARLDLTVAADLRAALLDRRGADLILDAGTVTHLGGLCLQVLLAARDLWGRSGNLLQVAPRSAAFAAALETFGLPATALEQGEGR